MKSFYLRSGSTVRIVGNAEAIKDGLDPATYVAKKDLGGFYLDQIENMELPEKIYGGIDSRVERVLNTFGDRPGNTGILLKGEKGSGKTLMVKMISRRMRELGFPTIIVNTEFSGEDFNTFIADLSDACLIVFDEFEKVYGDTAQQEILTLLDGTIRTKKLFVFTCNDSWRLNSYMGNRPGRIYYSWEYRGLTEDFIREYCDGSLNDMNNLQDLLDLAAMFTDFNFDMLKAVVEELNRYGEPVREVIKHLNIDPKGNGGAKYEGTVISAGDDADGERNHKVSQVNNKRPFNPMRDEFHVHVNLEQEDEDEDPNSENRWGETYEHWYFETSDLVEYRKGGTLVFRNGSGQTIEIRKLAAEYFDYTDTF